MILFQSELRSPCGHIAGLPAAPPTRCPTLQRCQIPPALCTILLRRDASGTQQSHRALRIFEHPSVHLRGV